MSTLIARLAKLEKALPPPPAHKDPREWTDEDWLFHFEHWGNAGHFDQEPDFQTALDHYRMAIDQAKAQSEPPWDPPADYGQTDLPHLRLWNWRRANFPEVAEARFWLFGMVLRRIHGEPPVGEAEFAELATWFNANADRLLDLSRPSYLLDLGNGRKDTVTNLRYRLERGPRSPSAGEVAEDLRRLRERHG
jgi:hypothetical protein